jgi:hypothetical protein
MLVVFFQVHELYLGLYLARMGDIIIYYNCGSGNVNGRGRMGDFDVHERIVWRNVLWVRNRLWGGGGGL